METLTIPSTPRSTSARALRPHRFSILSLFGGGIFLKRYGDGATGAFPFEKGN